MSTVEVLLTDARLWSRSESTHWDATPSIAPASDGTSFVVGEPMQPPSPAASVVRLAGADRIAFLPTARGVPAALPTLTDAAATMFGALLTNLHLSTPCQRLTVLGPSEWGQRRRAVLETAARRLVPAVEVEPLALRAASLDPGTAQHQRIAVLELSPLSTTVTLVGRSGPEIWIDACEHEPTVGVADVTEGHGLPGIGALVAGLLAGYPPTYLLALGAPDPAFLDAVREAIARQCGFAVDVRSLAGTELIRGVPSPMAAPMLAQPEMPAASEWVGSLHDRAVAVQPPRQRRTGVIAGIAAAAVVVIAVVAGLAVLLTGHKSTSVAADRTSAAPTSAPPTPQTFGRVQVVLPPGWRVSSQSTTRVDLMPNDGARQRILFTQQQLSPGASLDDVANTLQTQMQASTGSVTQLQRNVVFGGRTGLSYQEHPSDGTTVRWQVLVDNGTQVSVGCQYAGDSWQPLAGPCEQFVHDLKVTQ